MRGVVHDAPGRVAGLLACSERVAHSSEDVFGGRARDRSEQIGSPRVRPPAIQNPSVVGENQNPGLVVAVRMLNLPVGAALEKFQISAMDVKAQPTAVAALLRDLLMRVADRDELELPVLARLVRQ